MSAARLRILGALVAGLYACWLPTVAAAAEAGGPRSVDVPAIDAGAAVEAVAGPAPVALDPDGGPVPVAGGEVEVSIERNPDRGLEIDGRHGSSVSIGLPGAGTPDGVETASGLVYDGVAPATDVVARPTDDGVQALVVIDGPAAPSAFRFPIEVDGGAAALLELPDGAVQIRSRITGDVVGTVTPPWATDASGASVPTAFEVSGSTLVQTVDHRAAAYPVVADPNTCGWVTCTYYFGKRATRDLSNARNLAVLCAALKVVPPAMIGCGVAGVAVGVHADRAHSRGMCLKIKYVTTPTVWYPDIYSGKHCR